MIPHREGYWNIGSEHYLLIPIAIAAAAAFVYAFRKHYLMWRLGRAEDRFDHPGKRFWGLLLYGVANRRVLDEAYAGTMHLLIYGGMAVLFLGTIIDSAEYYLHAAFTWSFLQGSLYLVYSLCLDIAGLLVLVGLLLAFYRRYVRRPERLERTPDDLVSLALIGLIVIGGFMVEGFRISASEMADHPDWAAWSPVGYALASNFKAWAIPLDTQLVLHRVFWWVHLISAQAWIGYIFYSKLGHIFTASLNIYFRNLQPSGVLQPIVDMETADTLGAGSIQDLTWKQLLDLDACTRCGRCQDNCPAYLTGKPMSPKKLILDLKGEMLLVSSRTASIQDGVGSVVHAEPATIVDTVISEDAVWACTTCGGCQEVCPVFVEHINKVVDIRRNMVLMESRMPDTVQAFLTSMEKRGHPWAGTQNNRSDWIREVGLKGLEPAEEVDLLYWVGCTGALERRSKGISSAVVKLLQAAGVSFGVLGSEEGCCGDPARRVGNEYLFQSMAEQNIEVLKSHRVKRIVTHCPHCLNSLKNEYPQFGGDFQVVHHSQLLAELVQQGRLRLRGSINEKVVIHDSCYLGRHNGIFGAPRDLLKGIPGLTVAEASRSGGRSFCCGGGGGHMWMDDTIGTRISEVRAGQLMETGATVVAVSCPFCLQMIEAGINASDQARSTRIRDISELLEEALEPSRRTPE